MRKILFLAGILSLLFLAPVLMAQEKFIDVRQKMADNLTEVKKAIRIHNNWEEAADYFNRVKSIWEGEVKPIIVEGIKRDSQFKEYFERMKQVDEDLSHLEQLLGNKTDQEIEQKANAIIWAISHHPRGFDVAKPRYSLWDWAFGLGIGIGFCLFATFFGLYLRRSYYRRYKRENF